MLINLAGSDPRLFVAGLMMASVFCAIAINAAVLLGKSIRRVLRRGKKEA